MSITAKTKMCIIIGDPVEHSLSPAMHNAAYKALGIDDKFVFTAAHVQPEHLETVVKAVRAMGVRGLTCTIPHKIEVMQYLDEVDPVAKKIGAVNTVVNENGTLKGYNTDWIGTIAPLEKYTDLAGKKVAILGAGGAARAMAYGVCEKKARLTIYNRTLEKAKELANELNSEAADFSQLNSIQEAEIIINSTPIGMAKTEGSSPIPKELLRKEHIVFDAVYKPHKTQLLTDAEQVGAQIIYGYEMLLHQGIAQFELYTGIKPPQEVMENIIKSNL